MSENLMLGAIAFFSAIVTLMTATIGYFKVLRPQRQYEKRNGDQHDTIFLRISGYEDRIARLEAKIETLQQQLLDLKKENYELLQENARLRRQL